MSTRLFVKSGVSLPNVYKNLEGNKPYIWETGTCFDGLKDLDQTVMEHIEYITVTDSFWYGLSGYSFASGVYEGEGFEVHITPSCSGFRQSGKDKFFDDYSQKVSGRFDTIEIAIAFWDALTRGEILPTRPLCRDLSVTEQVYAKQAAAGVAAVAKLSDLQSQIDQMLNHIKNLEQVIQKQALQPSFWSPNK